jgi:probable phosphoglycerate mutase
MRPVKLVIWRHGQTDWNIQERFQGHTDIPLNKTGEFQVRHAAQKLVALKPTQIISSDLTRAKQTAAALSELTQIPVRHFPELRETNGGHWEGNRDSQTRESDRVNWVRWIAGEDIPAGDVGESRSMVGARVKSFLDTMVARLEEQDTYEEAVLVVVTHGGAARAIIGTALELPVASWQIYGGLSNACWSILQRRHLPRAFSDSHFVKEVEKARAQEAATGKKVQEPPIHSSRWSLIEHNAGSIPEPVFSDESNDENNR